MARRRFLFRMSVSKSPDLKATHLPSGESFQDHLGQLKSQVETALDAALAGRDWPPTLSAAVRYSLMAGGKRLRPILVLLANQICGGKSTAAIPAACAIEMIHTYSLIHDDLPAMDDDDYRRGRLTSHKVFGEALAILAGDGLLTLAFETLAAAELPAEVRMELTGCLATAAGGGGMVGGQVLDLEAERGTFLPPGHSDRQGTEECGVSSEIRSNCDVQNRVDHLTQIHTMKTGALIAAAVELGAICAGAGAEHRAVLKHYGRNIGLAFQITDDLLDVTGDGTRLGKVPGRDADLGKLTYVAMLGIEQSRLRAAELVDEACRLIDGLNAGPSWLQNLARFIVERDH